MKEVEDEQYERARPETPHQAVSKLLFTLPIHRNHNKFTSHMDHPIHHPVLLYQYLRSHTNFRSDLSHHIITKRKV